MEVQFHEFVTNHVTVYLTACRRTIIEISSINWSILPRFYCSPTLHPICTTSISPTTAVPHCTLPAPLQSVQHHQSHTAPYLYHFSQSNPTSPTLHPICTTSVSPTPPVPHCTLSVPYYLTLFFGFSTYNIAVHVLLTSTS